MQQHDHTVGAHIVTLPVLGVTVPRTKTTMTTSVTKGGLLPPPSSICPTLLMTEQRTAWTSAARLFMCCAWQRRTKTARVNSGLSGHRQVTIPSRAGTLFAANSHASLHTPSRRHMSAVCCVCLLTIGEYITRYTAFKTKKNTKIIIHHSKR